MILFDACVRQEHRANVRALAVELINEAVEKGLLPIMPCPLFGSKEK